MIKKANGKNDYIDTVQYYLTAWLAEHIICAVFGHKLSGRPGMQACERCGRGDV